MEAQQLIQKAKEIITSNETGFAKLTAASEFIRIYAGEKSAFYKNISKIQGGTPAFFENHAKSFLESFINFIERGLLEGVSIERKAQIDVVSDFLEQAQDLLSSTKVHPAAPAVIIGAALEEFLRNWVEEAGLSLGNRKPGIDSYATTLKEVELITKQDVKDIVSWAGIRNSAAHGEWEEVNNRQRITIMLESVNLFMRKYTKL